MRRDLLAISGGILTAGVIAWVFWGNPENVPRMHTLQAMAADTDLRLVSERSPYMRNER
jgi:hypothetical protein